MSSGIRLAGVIPPVTTPFDASGEVDLAGLAANIQRYEQVELAGYLAFGSNGEAVHLTAGERGGVVETLRRSASAERVVIAGVNEQSTRAAIAAVQQVADSGADAALVITPYFYKAAMSQDALRGFFTAVADAAPLPILTYNIPQNTGVTLAPRTLGELAEHPNIVGAKDSSGNLAALAETVRRVGPDFAVLVGSAAITYPALTMGATGAILAVACVAPEACVRLFAAATAGGHERARLLQHQLTPVAEIVTTGLGIPGLKAAADLVGLAGGLPRAPLMPVTDGGRQQLLRVLRESGLVNLVPG